MTDCAGQFFLVGLFFVVLGFAIYGIYSIGVIAGEEAERSRSRNFKDKLGSN